jgi:hypothetical protein
MHRPHLHKSTLVIATTAITIAILLEMPGRVVSGSLAFSTEVNEIEHGWPWVYLHRNVRLEGPDFDVPLHRRERMKIQSFLPPEFETWADLPMGGVPWLRPANWRVWQSIDDKAVPHWEFNRGNLVADVVVTLFVVAAIIAAFEFRCRRRAPLLNFGIVEMLVAVALVSGALGWVVHMKNEHRRELQLADDRRDSSGPCVPFDMDCVAPLWFRSLFGDRLIPSYFWRVSEVYIAGSPKFDLEACTRQLAQFKCATRVTIDGDAPGLCAALQYFKRIDTVFWEPRGGRPNQLPTEEIALLTHVRKLIIVDKKSFPAEQLKRLEAALPNCSIIEEWEDW